MTFRTWTADFGSIIKVMMERMGVSIESFTGAMGEWSRSAGLSVNHTPPERGTIRNYINGGRAITFGKLEMLCAYVLYGRFGKDIDADAWSQSRDMAEAALMMPPASFFERYKIERAESVQAAKRKTASPERAFIDQMMDTARLATGRAHDLIETLVAHLEDDPTSIEMQFEPLTTKTAKTTTFFDFASERECREVFRRVFGADVEILGEESMKANHVWKSRYGVLIDAVDGTDVMAMGVNLWSSAVAVLDTEASRIVGTVVALPSGAICSARYDEDGAWRDNGVSLGGCSDVTDLKDARIACYGQKAKNLYALATNERLATFLKTIAGDDSARFRLFNFAGNNMIVRMADRPKAGSVIVGEGVDVVFEPFGQRPHDFVPGMFLALKTGAYACELDGEPIDEKRLAAMMNEPDRRVTYVIAGSKVLCDAVLETFGSPGGTA